MGSPFCSHHTLSQLEHWACHARNSFKYVTLTELLRSRKRWKWSPINTWGDENHPARQPEENIKQNTTQARTKGKWEWRTLANTGWRGKAGEQFSGSCKEQGALLDMAELILWMSLEDLASCTDQKLTSWSIMFLPLWCYSTQVLKKDISPSFTSSFQTPCPY